MVILMFLSNWAFSSQYRFTNPTSRIYIRIDSASTALLWSQKLTWRPLCPSPPSAWRDGAPDLEQDLWQRRSCWTLTWRSPARWLPLWPESAPWEPECFSFPPGPGCTASAGQCPRPGGGQNIHSETGLFKRRLHEPSTDLVQETPAQGQEFWGVGGKYGSCFIWTVHSQHPPTEVHYGIWERNRFSHPDLVREVAIEF